jgi:hypothetical protein
MNRFGIAIFCLIICFSLGCTRDFNGTLVNNSSGNVYVIIYTHENKKPHELMVKPFEIVNLQEKYEEIHSIIETPQGGTPCKIDRRSFQIGAKRTVVDFLGTKHWRYELKGCKGDGGVLIKR